MSKLLAGTVTTTTFKIADPNALKNITNIREKIEAHGFKTLDPNDVRSESTGWVDPLLSFDNEEYRNISQGRFIVLAMRTDSYSFSASQLRPHMEEEMHKYLEEHDVKKLGKQIKGQIKDRVVQRLRMSNTPKTNIVEVVIDLDSSKVIVFSNSGGNIRRFEELFQRTFEVGIEIDNFIAKIEEFGKDKTSVASLIWNLDHADSNIFYVFLLWLYVNSGEDAEFEIPCGVKDSIFLSCEDSITLASVAGNGCVEKISAPIISDFDRVKRAIKSGLIPSCLKMRIIGGANDWIFQFNNKGVSNVKLPITGEKEEIDIMGSRFDCIEILNNMMNDLFDVFKEEYEDKKEFVKEIKDGLGIE